MYDQIARVYFMIAFDLCCSQGHTFEGWFEDSSAFDIQMQNGFVNCPVCDDLNVRKLLSPVAIRKNTSLGAASQISTSPEESLKIIEQMTRELKEFVDKNFEDVGTDFTKEALKIHYGVEEPRNIRGVSSESDEGVLRKEGISFFKLPSLARTDNDPEE